ncbi:hypothetical protein PINS_up001622 [Pythium insidiosum]|nr:hypothetical protein PINS_up001622 [Pythium insidiosum]
MGTGLTNADFSRMFLKASRPEDESDATGNGSTETVEPAEEGSNSMAAAAMRQNERLYDTYGGGGGDEDERPRFGGLGLGLSSAPPTSGGDSSEGIKADEPSVKKKVLSEAELRRRFTWEKHTKGFGLKMMAKMGFTGRLGKDEKGVSTTIEVVQRPAQMGLGFGSFKEASALRQNKRVERELRGDSVDEREKTPMTEDAQQDDSLWRKRKTVSVPKKTYKRAADISEKAHAAAKTRNEVILDMRGPDVRVLGQLTEAFTHEQVEASNPKLGDELIHNVRMVVNLAQGRIYDLTQKIDANTATLESIRQERKILSAQVETDRIRWASLEKLMEKVRELEPLVDKSMEDLSVVGLLSKLRELRDAYQREFVAYNLHQLVPSLMLPTLKALLSSSDMQRDDTITFIVEQFRQVQLFLLELPDHPEQSSSDGVGIFFHIREKTAYMGDEIYNYILEESLWPTAVHLVSVQWDVKNDPSACAKWYERFRPHLSAEFSEAFLHELVLPRLKLECRRWNPQTDTTLIQDWLDPWVIHLGVALNTLNSDIQLTLGNAMAQWHPSDFSALPVITPWRQRWDELEYAKFTHRHIIRKLARCLQRDLRIDPVNQSLDSLEWVFAWHDHLPRRQFVALLEGEFFPKWLRVLRQWISASPNLHEVVTWYTGWKRYFEQHGLAKEPRLVIHFHGALELMDAACKKMDDPSYELPKLNPNAPNSYQDAILQASDHPASASSTPSHEQAAASATRVKPSMSLKDLIEHLAVTHDVTFMPKGFHNGQQLYVFGKYHILIDQGVVFLETSKGQFKPILVDDLVKDNI